MCWYVYGDIDTWKKGRIYNFLCPLLTTDINECCTEEHNCHMNAECTNTDGGFECNCREGYVGNGVQCTGEFCVNCTPYVHYSMLSLKEVFWTNQYIYFFYDTTTVCLYYVWTINGMSCSKFAALFSWNPPSTTFFFLTPSILSFSHHFLLYYFLNTYRNRS